MRDVFRDLTIFFFGFQVEEAVAVLQAHQAKEAAASAAAMAGHKEK